MQKLIYQIHIWLGILVSIPVLAWASSGLIYSLPNAVEGNKIDSINVSQIKISPSEAVQNANHFADRELPITALTLLMRDGKAYYQAVGGMGADSLLINAETGEVLKTPQPNLATRYFRQAHFYYFAGNWQTWLLIVFSTLACFSVLSGIYLNLRLWLKR